MAALHEWMLLTEVLISTLNSGFFYWLEFTLPCIGYQNEMNISDFWNEAQELKRLGWRRDEFCFSNGSAFAENTCKSKQAPYLENGIFLTSYSYWKGNFQYFHMNPLLMWNPLNGHSPLSIYNIWLFFSITPSE